ncbi:hypothetical protein CH63R_11250 [Colletotrichum higginsianum IMI 349063]|uniref:Ribosome biogenesis protein SLX9 n=3 Tax=Colletotrichum higginsianum TaxID=80884 RepID=A0A1B7XXP2_COLHI|nr:hypothetical protein CH63R_11250 [Colletotrichum higginsianum IMI 349063]OBR04547.1 hypothetical protein CH63R_11250 [Colletotrichum higginsianum IMI 349063]
MGIFEARPSSKLTNTFHVRLSHCARQHSTLETTKPSASNPSTHTRNETLFTMAPTAPTKTLSAREKRMARIRGDIHPLAPHKTLRPEAKVDDSFLTNKKDKRTMKHSAFVSKVEKANKKPLKRRRPNKKLVTTMESLADALPDLDEGAPTLEQLREGKVRHKSLKSRPGALKRKEKVVRGEMQRFGASMAALASVPAAPAPASPASPAVPAGAMAVEGSANGSAAPDAKPDATSSRWAALRRHISSTMEQNPAFSK